MCIYEVLAVLASTGQFKYLHAHFLVLRASASGVARLVTHITSVLIDARVAELAVTIELVELLASLIDAMGCRTFATWQGVLLSWPFARHTSGCKPSTGTLRCFHRAHF